MKAEKAYLLYANERYFDIVSMCAKSIREVSELPILVYLLNSDMKLDVENTTTINWKCDVSDASNEMYHPSDKNFYIRREHTNIYNLLIQRPAVTLDALDRYANTVVYLDSDIIVTPYIDSIFSMYDVNCKHPYLTAGVYDFLFINNRGSATELDFTLEYPLCRLLGVDQTVRQRYRTTNIYIAGQAAIPFIREWNSTCNIPAVKSNHNLYAPFHEETVINVLLWKYKYLGGLPYIYVNGGLEEMYEIDVIGFSGKENPVRDWFTIPERRDYLLAYHGEKRLDKMQAMIDKLKQKQVMKVLFLAPHLSTGGMPAFLLKRIELLKKHTNIDVYVVEYQNYSDEYVVQKNKIKEMVTLMTLGENKMLLMDMIKNLNIDVVHIDEMIEGFDGYNTVPEELMKALYASDRTWRIVETCHNVWFNPDENKRYHPDAYAFCTPYHFETFKEMPSHKVLLEFPIEDLTDTYSWQDAYMELGFDGSREHVVNIGLWTQGKNQGEAVELARQLPHIDFHFVGNQAVNFQEYWEPIMKDLPPNCKVWGERDDTWKFLLAADVFMFNSTWECNPLVVREAISYGCKILARNLPQYCGMFDGYITPIDEKNLKKQLLDLLDDGSVKATIPEGQAEKFALEHYELYQNVVQTAPQRAPLRVIQYYVNQPFLEIKGTSDATFTVNMFDEKGLLHYQNKLAINSWVRLNRTYFTPWRTEIWEDDELVYESLLDHTGKRVYIAIDSASLGDTIAWIPYALEFKKKHNCHVLVSTFKNFLFKDVYPELEFVDPGISVSDLHGMYKIGWYYNEDREPELPNTIPLQKTATNILGLEYKEIRPRIAHKVANKYKGKYVTIATNSTAGCKFWTREAWQELINYLSSKGYKVVNVSLEDNPFDNCTVPKDKSMQNTMDLIKQSQFFIGLSSGLSWLAWALKKEVFMISNFTEADHEFTCHRITNTSVCNGCWNKPEYTFDKGDWDWCPVHKGTDRQFECQKSITAQMVIDKIEEVIKKVD